MNWLEKIRLAYRAEKPANNILVGNCSDCASPHCFISPRGFCVRCVLIRLKDFAQYPDDFARPILFLRQFHISSPVSDWSSTPDHYVRKTGFLERKLSRLSDMTNREDNLVAALNSLNIGPVIAIGRLGEDLPSNNQAKRLYFNDEVWQEKVRGLMLLSQLVVLEVGHSGGVEWEMATALKQLKPEKIIFSFVSWHLSSKFWKEGQWEILERTLPRIAGVQIPGQIKNNYLMYFENDWTPRLVGDDTAPPLVYKLHQKLKYFTLKRRIKKALWILLLFAPILYLLFIVLLSLISPPSHTL